MARVAISLEEMSLGGGPKFALHLAESLQEVGHHVTIFVERRGPWWDEIARRGLDGRCFESGRTESMARRARRLAQAWVDAGVQVVFLNASLLNRLGMLASCLLPDDRRAVMVLHGDFQALYRLADAYQAHWNCAVAVSPRVETVARARVPEKPVVGIPYGISVPRSDELAGRRGWERPVRLLYLGRLIDSHKGVLRLPRILAACQGRGLPVTLTVVGDGEDARALTRQFDREGVSDRLARGAAVPPERAAAVMRDHHVLLLPTNAEGLPLVVLEAQANGCVPVVTRLHGITDVALEHQHTGLLIDDPADAEAFADAVEHLAHPAAWQRLSEAGIDRARRLFSLETMQQRYATLVAELVDGAYPLQRPFNVDGRLASPPFQWRDHLPPHDPPPALVRGVRRARRWVGQRLGRPEPRL